MASTFGRKTLTPVSGYDPMVLANNTHTRWKTGGVTIDWSTVTAVGSDTTLADGTVVKAGDKYIRYGTILNKITATGYFGPAATSAGGATAATDGRQTTARGTSFILNQTVVESELGSAHPAVFEGGVVYKARLNVDGTGTPTTTQLEAAFPLITYALD